MLAVMPWWISSCSFPPSYMTCPSKSCRLGALVGKCYQCQSVGLPPDAQRPSQEFLSRFAQHVTALAAPHASSDTACAAYISAYAQITVRGCHHLRFQHVCR
jgi:hypothetical protein